MTALAAERNTPTINGEVLPQVLSIPLAAGAKVYKGGIVALNASGYGIAGAAGVGLVVVGRAEKTVDNTSGSNGTLSVEVRRGAFKYANSATVDAIAQVDVGRMCFVVDDQTVARTSSLGARSAAGRIVQVDTDGVWVELGVDPDPEVKDIYLTAAADLSALQFTFVKMNSSGQAAAASAAGEDCIGVLQNAPASGATAVVRERGMSTMAAGATIAVGALVATTAAGLSKTAVASSTNTSDAGAASDPLIASFVMGRAWSAGTNGSNHRIRVQLMGAIPTTAA